MSKLQTRTQKSAAVAANVAKTRTAEAEAARKVAAKLAEKKKADAAKPKEVKELAKGNGALIGVAKGALDGQPHTKRAVEEAMRRAKAEGKLVAKDIGGNMVVVDPADPKVLVTAKGAFLFPNVTRRNDAAKAAEEAAKKPAKEPKEAKPAKAKAEKKAPPVREAAPNRKITIVDKAFIFGADGTSRRASWDACKKAKDTDAYKAAGGAAKYLSRWVAAGAIKLG